MANDLTTHEKVDVVIAGAGASGSTFAAVLAKAGKKVVLIDNGPDWQLTDLISSDIWGRRIKPAGPPFILEGKQVAPIGYHGGWGVGGAALRRARPLRHGAIPPRRAPPVRALPSHRPTAGL